MTKDIQCQELDDLGSNEMIKTSAQSRVEFGSFKCTDEIKRDVLACLESGWLSMGPITKRFEEGWKSLFRYPYARALSSGTAADTACCMALHELGARPDGEIICPALSFIATGNAIRAAGFEPVFVDVKMDMNLDESKIEEKITDKTVAIMVVNLMGRPAELDIIKGIADKHRLRLIVDNCEAYGSKFKGEYSLHYADMETSSHFLAHIITTAEGGMVSTNHKAIDELIEAIRSHGRMGGSSDFKHEIFGLNFKPTDLNLSTGLQDLNRFWEIFRKRKENLQKMYQACREYDEAAWFVEEDKDRVNAPHAFSLITKEPGQIRRLTDTLDTENIAWKKNFGSMPTRHRAFNYLCYGLGDFPNAEYIGDNGIHIGVHKYLTEEDLGRITKVLTHFLRTL